MIVYFSIIMPYVYFAISDIFMHLYFVLIMGLFMDCLCMICSLICNRYPGMLCIKQTFFFLTISYYVETSSAFFPNLLYKFHLSMVDYIKHYLVPFIDSTLNYPKDPVLILHLVVDSPTVYYYMHELLIIFFKDFVMTYVHSFREPCTCSNHSYFSFFLLIHFLFSLVSAIFFLLILTCPTFFLTLLELLFAQCRKLLNQDFPPCDNLIS